MSFLGLNKTNTTLTTTCKIALCARSVHCEQAVHYNYSAGYWVYCVYKHCYILNPQSGRPGLPPLFVYAAATTTQQQTSGCWIGGLKVNYPIHIVTYCKSLIFGWNSILWILCLLHCYNALPK